MKLGRLLSDVRLKHSSGNRKTYYTYVPFDCSEERIPPNLSLETLCFVTQNVECVPTGWTANGFYSERIQITTVQ
jgi:hypothetical protein